VSSAWWLHPQRDGESLLTSASRWAGAALCVAAVQGGLVWAALNWPQPTESAGEPAGAIMIEIAPVPIAPDVPAQEVAVGPEQAQSEESQANKSEEKPEEEVEPEPEPPKPQPEPIETPKVEEQPKAEAILPQQVEQPPEEKKPDPEIKEPVKEKKRMRRPPRQQSVASQAAAPKPVDKAERGKTNAAPRAGTSSSMSAATWRGRLVAHLNRHKRHPGGSARGVSAITFTISRSGNVTAVSLARSSGNAALDQAALSLARRASPVPAPPDSVPGGSITISVPVRFTR